jgi:tetratricopeptide (TPR) repeat protein
MPTIMRVFFMLLCCTFMACASLGPHSDAEKAFEAGLALFNQGQYDKAVPQFVTATERNPEFGRAYLYLGRSYLSLRRWGDAIPPIRSALNFSPKETKKEVVNLLVDALLGAAVSNVKQGNFQASIAQLQEVLTLSPQSAPAKQHLVSAFLGSGGQLLSQGKLSDALNAFQEVTQLAPKNFEAYLGMAQAFWQQGDLLKALSSVNTALRLSPNSADAQSLLRKLRGF